MASKSTCPIIRAMASQVLKTLEEIERNSEDAGMTLEMKNNIAIDKLRRIIGSFATPHTSTPVGNSNVIVIEPEHAKSLTSQGTEEQEEKSASSSKTSDKSTKITQGNFSISSSGAEMEKAEVEKHLFQLVIGRCIVVYCTICNKQFKEKSFARKHIQQVHLNTKISEKSESESEKGPQETPVQNYVDSESVSMSTLSLQENEAHTPPEVPEEDNEHLQKETEENIAVESVVLRTENQDIENVSLVTRSKRSTRLEFVVMSLKNKMAKIKEAEVCVETPLSASDSNCNPGPSTSRISPVSSSQKMILRFDKQSLNRAMNARVVLKRLTSSELQNSQKIVTNGRKNRSGKKLFAISMSQKTAALSNSAQKTPTKETVAQIKRRLCAKKPTPHKYKIEKGKYLCEWPHVKCEFKNKGMAAPSKILKHHQSHRQRETKLKADKLDPKTLFCSICPKQLTNKRYFDQHMKLFHNK